MSNLSSADAPSELPEHVEEMPILTSTAQLEDKPAKDVVTQVGERRSSGSPIDEKDVSFMSRLS